MRVRILVSSPSDNRSLIRPYAPIRTFRGGRVRTPAPTAETDPGTLVRTTQAQEWNRSSGNFCKPRAQRPDEGIGPYQKRSIIAPSSGPFGATFPPGGRLKRIGGEAPAEIQGEKAQTPQSLRESGQRKNASARRPVWTVNHRRKE